MAMLDPITDWLLRRDGRDRSSRDIAEEIGRGASDQSFLSEPPPPAAAATPNFDLTRPRVPSTPAGAPVTFPPAQEFGSPMLTQGFGDASPVAAALAPPAAPPAAPSAAPAPGRPSPDPSWLGMLNVNHPNAAPTGWEAPSQSAPTASTATPPSAPAAPSKEASPAVPESSLLGRLFNGVDKWRNDNRLTLMALGAGMAGAQNIGQGLNRGMTMAVPAMQADIKQAQQNQTVAALIKRGLPQDVALAAAGNPAIMQQIIGQVFGPKQQQHVMVKDRLGNEIPLSYDPARGKYYDASGQPWNGGSGTSLSAGDPSKTGEEYLKTLDPMTQSEVKAFAEGRAPVTARNLQTMLPLVTQYDPTFDASQYPVRLATRKSYTSGKDFQETQALNTVGGHLGKLMDSADALDNSTWKPINRIRNWYADTFTGSPELVKFRNDLVTAQNELAKAYHGGHVSDSAFAAFNKSINEAQTPAELKASIGELAGLLQSKIEAKESGYRSSMSSAPLPEQYRAINDEARHSFSRINDWAQGIKPASPAAAAAPGGAPSATPSGAVTTGAPPPGSSWQWTPQGLVPAAPAGRTSQAEPPMKGARLGFHQDGSRGWFVDDPNRPGKYMHVMVG